MAELKEKCRSLEKEQKLAKRKEVREAGRVQMQTKRREGNSTVVQNDHKWLSEAAMRHLIIMCLLSKSPFFSATWNSH